MTTKPLTTDELKKILIDHSLWLATNGFEGTRANLSRANLSGADLYEANLYEANLCGANLCGANLCGANLCGAHLSGANLCGANLCGANLCGANLYGANLSDAQLPDYQICPEGEFIGWKKVRGGVILKLRIIGDRTSTLVGRKCRTNKAFVVGAFNSKGDSVEGTFLSMHSPSFTYAVGHFVEEPNYSDDIRQECTSGIHFFLTRKEAERY